MSRVKVKVARGSFFLRLSATSDTLPQFYLPMKTHLKLRDSGNPP